MSNPFPSGRASPGVLAHVRAISRALACALLVLALTNPVLQREQRDRLPGVVALVVDRSGSQSLGRRTEQTDRAVKALRDRLQALGGYQIRTAQAFDRPNGDGTALFSELTRLLDDVPPDQVAGAVLVTDGQVHDIPPNAAASLMTEARAAALAGRKPAK